MRDSICKLHRWLSIPFTIVVIATLIAMWMGWQANWLGYLALALLIPLMLTGLYMFFTANGANKG